MILNLQGLTLTRGNANLGAAIYNDRGTLTVSDCVFSQNTATQPGDGGGGIFNQEGGVVTVVNSSFVDNSAAKEVASKAPAH
jgi:predicted outer membrane repeat protein